MVKTRIKDLMVFDGLGKTKVESVDCGEICALVGIEGFEIGDTVCDYENPEPLEPLAIDEPDDEHAVYDQRLSLFRPRGASMSPRAISRSGSTASWRRISRCGSEPRGVVRQFRRVRTRRAASVGADRDDAPRRVRASGRAAESHHQADRRGRSASRSRS